MKPIKSFIVSPILPKKLKDLEIIANNLLFSWNANMRDLFTRLDMDLWEKTCHNPVEIISKIDQKTLNDKANDDSYVYLLGKVKEEFDRYIEKTTWFENEKKLNKDLKVAYFSMEYGITESLAIYSGGLGVLSGDHLKSSSELGIPLIAVGLSYQNGYFKQKLNINGWQEQDYPINDFYNLPMSVVRDKNGKSIIVKVSLPGRDVSIKIWKAKVGRISLYLLDTNIKENSEEDRIITAELYSGDNERRIKQEIVLGMGGIKALKAVGEKISICHMNEGHSAFAGLERIKDLVINEKLSFHEAVVAVKAATVFTTHTPVKAGIDLFDSELVKTYFHNYCNEVGVSMDEFLSFGRVNQHDEKEKISMAILAIKLSYLTNGVSQLHGKVAQKMWRNLWPEVLTQEVPITAVTNGIHHASWISMELAELFDRYLGPKWIEEPADNSIWKKVDDIPDGELWGVHERRRARLVGFARKKQQEYFREIEAPNSIVQKAKSVLNTNALTIGFARRFATYKRATLIFKDPDRLAKILNNEDRPVQILIAGKAHPQDNEGKKFISDILELTKEDRFSRNVVFLEDYNMNIARYLVSGCDIWLNNPRRGLEACGTSGMKAAANGCLNCSTLDGWWDEIYSPEIGWAIGNREEYQDMEFWDNLEAEELYTLLESQIVPTFYNRGEDRMPREWIKMMKQNMITNCAIFNSNRMLQEYTERMYVPSNDRAKEMTSDNFKLTREVSAWKEKMRAEWNTLRFLKVDTDSTIGVNVGTDFNISAEIYLGNLTPDDIDVQLFYGKLNSAGHIDEGEFISMNLNEKNGDNKYIFKSDIDKWDSGLNGFTLRIIPKHKGLANPFEDRLIYWFEEK